MAESKVVLPKEVAEAIEMGRRNGMSNFNIVHLAWGAVFAGPDKAVKEWAFDPKGEGSPDLLMEALVNGYEIERTPHEELLEYYGNIRGNHAGYESYGVIRTLSILGITVEGING